MKNLRNIYRLEKGHGWLLIKTVEGERYTEWFPDSRAGGISKSRREAETTRDLLDSLAPQQAVMPPLFSSPGSPTQTRSGKVHTTRQSKRG